MACSSLKNKITAEFLNKIQNTYLDADDLRQEVNIAFIVTKKEDEVREYIKNILEESIRENPIGLNLSLEPIDYVVSLESKKKLLIVISALLERCSRKQRTIVRLIYGLLDGKCHDYQEIALMFRVPIERIKEIEKAAFCKLKKIKELLLLKTKFF
jgi:DNA-directed RNA polymerase sigma subunit (sigma70/sigma32)